MYPEFSLNGRFNTSICTLRILDHGSISVPTAKSVPLIVLVALVSSAISGASCRRRHAQTCHLRSSN